MRPLILLVEDEHDYAALICEFLERADYQTKWVTSETEAQELLSNRHDISLVIVDLYLNEINPASHFRNTNGMRLLQQNQGGVPKIVLTAKASFGLMRECLKGNNGVSLADSCFSKGEDIHELMLEIARLLAFRLDPTTKSAIVNGKIIKLSDSRFEVLQYLYAHRGTVCPWEEIAKSVWGVNITDENRTSERNRLREIVRRLREALNAGGEPGSCRYIHTVNGIGYRFLQESPQ